MVSAHSVRVRILLEVQEYIKKNEMATRRLDSRVKKTALEELTKLQDHLRNDVFPYMNDDELFKFMTLLKKWTNDMIGE